MTGIIRQRVIVRRFRYMLNRVYNKDLYIERGIIRTIPALHPSQEIEGRHYVRLGGIICCPTMKIYKSNYEIFFEKFKKLWYRKTNPNGNGDNDKSELIKQRDEEVKKSQDLRQRTLEHPYDHESVWKAMKERDELLRRDQKDKGHNNGKSENDESK